MKALLLSLFTRKPPVRVIVATKAESSAVRRKREAKTAQLYRELGMKPPAIARAAGKGDGA
jgi:hypothetical protein